MLRLENINLMNFPFSFAKHERGLTLFTDSKEYRIDFDSLYEYAT